MSFVFGKWFLSHPLLDLEIVLLLEACHGNVSVEEDLRTIVPESLLSKEDVFQIVRFVRSTGRELQGSVYFVSCVQSSTVVATCVRAFIVPLMPPVFAEDPPMCKLLNKLKVTKHNLFEIDCQLRDNFWET
jgi:hypothetical protein